VRGTIDSCRDPVTQSETEQMLGEPVAAISRTAVDGLAGSRAGADQPGRPDLAAAALGELTQEHRDVLRECYFRGSSVAQAADALEIAPDMVKSRAYYALHALRLAIEELESVQ